MTQVLWPSDAIDPRTSLASALYAAPGVYAVLLGSGISKAAGVPTGWEVVEDLSKLVARAEGIEPEDPVAWFEATYKREPSYDELVERLAPTDLARRALLRGYFDPLPQEGGPATPTAAHEVIARLCAQERIRVVMTTNFDHLLERALANAGASSQVLINSDHRKGMEPLQHARTTVLKLHGDYTDRMLNTRAELAKYPKDLRDIVDEVFNRYGLIVVGWSAQWDVALVNALTASEQHRYPAYWSTYEKDLNPIARRVVEMRDAAVIDGHGADEFFLDLEERVERLATVARRKQQPAALWNSRHGPGEGFSPPGWSATPRLVLRAIVEVAPVALDACSPIGWVQRAGLIEAITDAPVVKLLRSTSQSMELARADGRWEQGPFILDSGDAAWLPVEVEPNGLTLATYRLGTDGQYGISALIGVQLPSVGRGSVLLSVDVGLSLDEELAIGTVAWLWRDSLMLLTGPVLDALAGCLPDHARLASAELHAVAPLQANGATGNLRALLALGHFGRLSSRDPLTTLGQAMRIDEPLKMESAGVVVADAFERIAMQAGYRDPRQGVDELRRSLTREADAT